MPRRAHRTWILIGTLWLAALAYYLTRDYLHPDVSWVLLATGRMLDGARLYRDIIEVNPPLIFYSAVPGVLLARLAGWPVMAGFSMYVLLLVLGSLVLAALIQARAMALPARAQGFMILAGLLALVLLPVADFGEREHFTAILTLPYVGLLAARYADRDCDARLAIIAGLAAGIGLAFKPHFLVVPLALELYQIVRCRSLRAAFRPETVCAAVVIALYAGGVLLLHPEYLDRIVPYGILVYGAYAKPLAYAFLQPKLPTLLLPLAAYGLVRLTVRDSRFLDAYAIAAAGFFAAYLIQAKGWSYQLIPVVVFAWMCAAGAAMMLLDAQAIETSAGRRRLITATVVISLFGLAATPAIHGSARSPFAETLAPIVQRIAPSGSLYAFTSHVWVPFPLVSSTGHDWASRFPAQWLLPGIVNGLRAGAGNAVDHRGLEEIERFTIDAVIEDLQANRPEIVLVDRDNPYFDEPGFDYIGYFDRDPRFHALWRNYVKADELAFDEMVPPTEQGDFHLRRTRRFEIYCRRDTAPGCAASEAIADAAAPAPG
jgi:hypothetical protein